MCATNAFENLPHRAMSSLCMSRETWRMEVVRMGRSDFRTEKFVSQARRDAEEQCDAEDGDARCEDICVHGMKSYSRW